MRWVWWVLALASCGGDAADLVGATEPETEYLVCFPDPVYLARGELREELPEMIRPEFGIPRCPPGFEMLVEPAQCGGETGCSMSCYWAAPAELRTTEPLHISGGEARARAHFALNADRVCHYDVTLESL